ncbi:hypothetical protein BO79DRAFT_229619 [Aspergillus costaricaensis CBS 115574]|uniref:Uncharacterized protein n=1 Tax=Aspergillus costaricaensis CBS 115574 TaxID=1448317 RepID=A0ACD1IBP6_9EURO|nr:hypothetical protein BO79DRAFT_229619 [Aspergillus costaricaensis CBS 115574]RAK87711.1 hypothetical protein BO79DRAFT_229619 [Aspergillus costaricaensis CBS 115574]
MKTGREKGDSRATGACRTRSPCHRNNGTISGDDGVIAEGSMVENGTPPIPLIGNGFLEALPREPIAVARFSDGDTTASPQCLIGCGIEHAIHWGDFQRTGGFHYSQPASPDMRSVLIPM